jgi:hypothetical protein
MFSKRQYTTKVLFTGPAIGNIFVTSSPIRNLAAHHGFTGIIGAAASGMIAMKPKMHQQIQPREIATLHGVQLQGEVQEEIRNFLRAVDSYPARVSKEPRVTFQQHLCSIFAGRSSRNDSYRRDIRIPRH